MRIFVVLLAFECVVNRSLFVDNSNLYFYPFCKLMANYCLYLVVCRFSFYVSLLLFVFSCFFFSFDCATRYI